MRVRKKPQTAPIDALPNELLGDIGKRLPWPDQVAMLRASKRLAAAVQDEEQVALRQGIRASVLGSPSEGRSTAAVRKLWCAAAHGLTVPGFDRAESAVGLAYDLGRAQKTREMPARYGLRVRAMERALRDELGLEFSSGPRRKLGQAASFLFEGAADAAEAALFLGCVAAASGVGGAVSALTGCDPALPSMLGLGMMMWLHHHRYARAMLADELCSQRALHAVEAQVAAQLTQQVAAAPNDVALSAQLQAATDSVMRCAALVGQARERLAAADAQSKRVPR